MRYALLLFAFSSVLFANPLLDYVARCIGGAVKFEPQTYARIMDSPPIDSGSLASRATKWSRRARSHVARLDVPAAQKVALLRSCYGEIQSRMRTLSARMREGKTFKFNEVKAGGTVVFIGEYGNFAEIRPDGSVHKGKLRLSVVSSLQFLNPSWKPQGSADGLDSRYIFEREPVTGEPESSE